ncbi:hypothetical protein M8J76_010773 [Diaphorina citri]|nr:hypothetical protein M8J75_009421 [Diaphorina citri]KAI5709125.1 hypothetical protein M8J76_010773 [Diaphorina citri]
MDRLGQLEGAMRAFEARLEEVVRGGSGDNPPDSAALSLIQSLFTIFRSQVMEELSWLKTQLTAQGEHLDRLETYSRRTCILIHGIPEDQAQTEVQCLQAASDLFRNQLELDIPVSRMERAHRLGPRRTDGTPRPRPVIVKFFSYQDKRAVFYNKKKLKGRTVSVTESLTKTRLDILKKARDHFQARNVWTSDGKIVVKTGDPNNPKLTTLTTHRELQQAMVATPTTPAPTSTPAPDGLRNVNTCRPRLL